MAALLFGAGDSSGKRSLSFTQEVFG